MDQGRGNVWSEINLNQLINFFKLSMILKNEVCFVDFSFSLQLHWISKKNSYRVLMRKQILQVFHIFSFCVFCLAETEATVSTAFERARCDKMFINLSTFFYHTKRIKKKTKTMPPFDGQISKVKGSLTFQVMLIGKKKVLNEGDG